MNVMTTRRIAGGLLDRREVHFAAELWHWKTQLTQRLSWRTMVAVIHRDQAVDLLTSTVELRKDLEAHLAQ